MGWLCKTTCSVNFLWHLVSGCSPLGKKSIFLPCDDKSEDMQKWVLLNRTDSTFIVALLLALLVRIFHSTSNLTPLNTRPHFKGKIELLLMLFFHSGIFCSYFYYILSRHYSTATVTIRDLRTAMGHNGDSNFYIYIILFIFVLCINDAYFMSWEIFWLIFLCNGTALECWIIFALIMSFFWCVILYDETVGCFIKGTLA